MTQRIHSVYLSEEEEAAVLAVKKLNGTSANFVIRAAVRSLVGMPAPRLALPEAETGRREAAARTD